MGIHPYSEFGFKPVKINTNKKFMYHAVCESKYKKELSNGIYPPVFIATTPNIAEEIVKRVHNCKPKVIKIDISNLPVYKDLYWEMDDREFKRLSKEYDEIEPEDMPSDIVASLIMHDMNEDLRDLTKGNIFYIPKKVVKSRLNLKKEKGNDEISKSFYKLKDEFGYTKKANTPFGNGYTTKDDIAIFIKISDISKIWKDKLELRNLNPLNINKYLLYTQKSKYMRVGKILYVDDYIKSIYRIFGENIKIYQIPNLYLLVAKKNGYMIIIAPRL